MRRFCFLAIIAVMALSMSAYADLFGTNVTITWLYPDQNTVSSSQTVLVGPGWEVSCPGGYGGVGICPGFVDPASMDIGGTSISLFTTGCGLGCGFNTTPFNGFEFSGLSADLGTITGVNLFTNYPGLDSSAVTFTSDAVFINMSGISLANDAYFILELNSVPEPGSLLLLGSGLMGLAGTVRRKLLG